MTYLYSYLGLCPSVRLKQCARGLLFFMANSIFMAVIFMHDQILWNTALGNIKVQTTKNLKRKRSLCQRNPSHWELSHGASTVSSGLPRTESSIFFLPKMALHIVHPAIRTIRSYFLPSFPDPSMISIIDLVPFLFSAISLFSIGFSERIAQAHDLPKAHQRLRYRAGLSQPKHKKMA